MCIFGIEPEICLSSFTDGKLKAVLCNVYAFRDGSFVIYRQIVRKFLSVVKTTELFDSLYDNQSTESRELKEGTANDPENHQDR